MLIAGILLFVSVTFKTANGIETPTVDIVLDSGHGASDPGAIGAKGTIEKDINLAITLKIRDKLVAEGYSVGLTRETDTSLAPTKKKDMHWRRDFALASRPQVFVSIHQNTFPDRAERGAQIWYSMNHPESANFAANMQEKLGEVNSQNRRLPKRADNNIFLLRHLTMPAILIECGFISNADEEWLLTQPEHQERLAECIKKGIAGELERLKTVPTPLPATLEPTSY